VASSLIQNQAPCRIFLLIDLKTYHSLFKLEYTHCLLWSTSEAVQSSVCDTWILLTGVYDYFGLLSQYLYAWSNQLRLPRSKFGRRIFKCFSTLPVCLDEWTYSSLSCRVLHVCNNLRKVWYCVQVKKTKKVSTFVIV
jgi:hypothetical protein